MAVNIYKYDVCSVYGLDLDDVANSYCAVRFNVKNWTIASFLNGYTRNKFWRRHKVVNIYKYISCVVPSLDYCWYKMKTAPTDLKRTCKTHTISGKKVDNSIF